MNFLLVFVELLLWTQFGESATIAKANDGCRSDDWGLQVNLEQVGSKCYHFGQQAMNWDDAQQYCDNHGMTLATIINESEQKELRCHIINSGYILKHFWTGGHKVGNTWKWLSGDQMVYTGWYPHQPDNFFGVESCMEILELLDSFGWNDIHCNTRTIFPLCQTKSQIEPRGETEVQSI
ncbi:perlucin-like [Ctenocephalides felis]|uniref:perlucin-like n=1 Tax=Ctenocephalides felis TaxID=7515 RepID=UPI000E6E518D|nr:perlucin-like [Ctenocephalides felis]